MPFVPVQELVFIAGFFKFKLFFIAASLGAVAGAVRRTSKPKGGAKGLKFGKLFALLNRPYHQLLNQKDVQRWKKCCPRNANGEQNVILFPAH